MQEWKKVLVGQYTLSRTLSDPIRTYFKLGTCLRYSIDTKRVLPSQNKPNGENQQQHTKPTGLVDKGALRKERHMNI